MHVFSGWVDDIINPHLSIFPWSWRVLPRTAGPRQFSLWEVHQKVRQLWLLSYFLHLPSIRSSTVLLWESLVDASEAWTPILLRWFRVCLLLLVLYHGMYAQTQPLMPGQINLSTFSGLFSLLAHGRPRRLPSGVMVFHLLRNCSRGCEPLKSISPGVWATRSPQ